MRKLFYLMLVVLGTAAFVSCSKDDDDNNGGNQEPVYHYGEITMVQKVPTSYDNEISIEINTFNAGDTITIDWGNGHIQQVVTNENGMIDLDYTYSDREEHTITIKGNISGLNCYNYHLTSLDVSECSALTELRCAENQLTSLDVTKNTALTSLKCSGNQLTSLDISKNTALTYLECGDNQLTSLDVTKNTALTDLYCGYNQLTSLDVTKNTALTDLDCSSNQLTAEEMNKIYEALPTVENGDLYCDQLGNPGIAEQKGWDVYFQ